jgi:hypothetical protein
VHVEVANCCVCCNACCCCCCCCCRFTRIITAGRDGRLIKIDGAEPHQGAEDAAAYALEVRLQVLEMLPFCVVVV